MTTPPNHSFLNRSRSTSYAASLVSNEEGDDDGEEDLPTAVMIEERQRAKSIYQIQSFARAREESISRSLDREADEDSHIVVPVDGAETEHGKDVHSGLFDDIPAYPQVCTSIESFHHFASLSVVQKKICQP